MSLVEVLPEIQSLSRLDKIRLIQVLAQELEQDDGVRDEQTRSVELSGNLAPVEARVVVLSAVVGNFRPVRLAFAWAQTDAVSVILG